LIVISGVHLYLFSKLALKSRTTDYRSLISCDLTSFFALFVFLRKLYLNLNIMDSSGNQGNQGNKNNYLIKKMVKLFEEKIHLMHLFHPIRALEMCVTFPIQHMIDQFHQSRRFLTLFQNLISNDISSRHFDHF
jgi:hypothetical protein